MQTSFDAVNRGRISLSPSLVSRVAGAALLLCGATLCGAATKDQKPPSAPSQPLASALETMNLGFEQQPDPPSQSLPRWTLEGDGFEVTRESFARNSGTYSARLSWGGKERPSSRGFLTQRLDPALVAGKRVKLSGYLRQSKARSPNGLWIRADVGGICRAYNDMLYHTFSGGTRFKHHEIEVDIPHDADEIAFGIGIWNGTLWADDLNIEIVGDANPTKYSNVPHWHKSNFDNLNGVPDRYELGVDRSTSFSGENSAFIRSAGRIGALDNAVLSQYAEIPEECRGRRIRLVGYVKGSGFVCLYLHGWASTIKGDWQQLSYDVAFERRRNHTPLAAGRTMTSAGVTYLPRKEWGKSEWVRSEVPIMVTENTGSITYGLWMVNSGKAWMDNLSFEVEVAPETWSALDFSGVQGPKNLDFEN